MRMTTFIIGIIIITVVMTGFGIILADANEKYGAEYNADDLAAYQQMEGMNNLTKDIKNRVENQSTDRNLADVIGGFIADGKDTLMLSANAYNMFETMSDDGMGKLNLPPVFSLGFFAIILVILFIGIILAAILGRRL